MGNYSPVGDLLVIAISFVIVVLVACSYIRRTRSFRVFLEVLAAVMLAALFNVSYHSLLELADHGRGSIVPLVMLMRCLFHTALFTIMALYAVYIAEQTHLEEKLRRPYLMAAGFLLLAEVISDIVTTVSRAADITGIGGTGNRLIFMYSYIAFVVLLAVLLLQVRHRLYKRIMMGFYGTIAVAFFILLMERLHGQTSFTVATFLFPVIAMLYTMHSNPYDAEIGSLEGSAIEDVIHEHYRNGREFVFMNLYLRTFNQGGQPVPEEITALVRKFATDFFRGAQLFRADKGDLVLLFTKQRNPDYPKRIEKIMAAFYPEYEKFRFDYKIVIGESIDELSRTGGYQRLVHSVQREMEENTVHYVQPQDVERLRRNMYIISQLEDIYRRRDLDDRRVLAFCQPVFNVEALCYDTAEALMRLDLPDTGIIPPAEFIPLAEEYGYIHVLTEIILHKTCLAIHRLLEAGYDLRRISVNISALEMKDDAFCSDITGIIRQSGIPGEKIAFELTESQNDNDFLLMKEKIGELRQQGIKFYLDDFGTGYSNMERIMELPFDIIKFDRSLVTASDSSERSRTLVINLARLFTEMSFSVLYEGVENPNDEAMCIDMCAAYLQGFRYSQPIPIEELNTYLRCA